MTIVNNRMVDGANVKSFKPDGKGMKRGKMVVVSGSKNDLSRITPDEAWNMGYGSVVGLEDAIDRHITGEDENDGY